MVFVLWNPATREGKTVAYPQRPDCPAHLVPLKSFPILHLVMIKNLVVRIVEYKKRYNSFYVYSADSWTQIFCTPIHHSNIRVHSCFHEISFDGVHWIGFLNSELGESYDHHIIISFEMSHEVFQIIRFPDKFLPNKVLAVFNDCLAFLVYGITEYIEIWEMREHEIGDSWTKQLVVNTQLPIGWPLRFLVNGEYLMIDKNEALVLYNIASQEIKILQRTGYPNSFTPVQAIIYVESSFIHGLKCVLELLCLSSWLFVSFSQKLCDLEKMILHLIWMLCLLIYVEWELVKGLTLSRIFCNNI